MPRFLTWLVARLFHFTSCIPPIVTFNFTVFSLHAVLVFLGTVSIAGILAVCPAGAARGPTG